MLLAVDMGLRTGLALFGRDGRLVWYRSQHYGTRAQLRRAVHGLFGELPALEWLVIEGGGPIAEIWLHEARCRGVEARPIGAEWWRERLLLPRERTTGGRSKRSAGILARRVINWSGARRPTALRHDAAEAILIGLCGVVDVGWLDGLPPAVKSGGGRADPD